MFINRSVGDHRIICEGDTSALQVFEPDFTDNVLEEKISAHASDQSVNTL